MTLSFVNIEFTLNYQTKKPARKPVYIIENEFN
jgi:hypothetical protein